MKHQQNYSYNSSSIKDDAIKGFAFIMSAKQEDPAVATGLEKVNHHPNSQEG